jgi:hypothetical protein
VIDWLVETKMESVIHRLSIKRIRFCLRALHESSRKAYSPNLRMDAGSVLQRSGAKLLATCAEGRAPQAATQWTPPRRREPR